MCRCAVNSVTSQASRSCQRNHSFYFPPSELLNDSNTVRLAFIRDPFQRFVSFYLDKCVKWVSVFILNLHINTAKVTIFQLQYVPILRNQHDMCSGQDLYGTQKDSDQLEWDRTVYGSNDFAHGNIFLVIFGAFHYFLAYNQKLT